MLYTEIHMLVCILLDVRSSGIPTQIDTEYLESHVGKNYM